MSKLYRIGYEGFGKEDELIEYIIAKSMLGAGRIFLQTHNEEEISWISIEHLKNVVNMPKSERIIKIINENK